MGKDEAVALIKDKVEGLARKTVEQVYNAVFELIAETVCKKEEFKVIGFGVFKVKKREARKGRNPKTGEEIEIPTSYALSFSPSDALSKRIKEIPVE